jgi:hypothetical protein
MISTLEELVDPLSESAFLTLLSERRLTYLPCVGTNRFDELFNWDTLVRAFESGAIPLGKVQVTKDLATVTPLRFAEGGKPSVTRLTGLLDHGCSVVLRRLHEHVPSLRELQTNIMRRTRERIRLSAVVTTGQSGALPLHFDSADILVLQIEGTKRWRIWDSPVIHAVPGVPKPEPSRERPAFEGVLQPGDLLLVPSGYWHECTNGPARSLHVAVLFLPFCSQSVVKALATRMLTDQRYRRPLIRPAGALPAVEGAVRASLAAEVRGLSLSEMLDDYLFKEDDSADY